ncbi:MAG: hypothetical protein R3E89_14470 [Thiolinea sp.]
MWCWCFRGDHQQWREVLPFHARLFASAVSADVLVQPVAIRYLNAQGEPSECGVYQ